MIFYNSKFNSTFVFYIFLNLALYIVLFQIQNVNIFWILNNLAINLFILLFTNKISTKLKLLYLFTLISLFFILFYPIVKITSYLLSLYLVISAAIQLNYLLKNVDFEFYNKILSNIFFIFLIAYFIQCFCVIIHLPIFNGFGLTKENTSIFRLNAFSPEPSMASQLTILIMYLTNINKSFKLYRPILFELLGLFLMILFGSVFGYLSLLIYIFVIHRKCYQTLFKIELIFGTIFTVYFLNTSETLSRISSLLNYLVTEFDIDKLASIEPSGSFRFYPLLFYFQNFSLFDLNYIIGFGPGISGTFFNEGLMTKGFGLDLDSNFQGGFIPSFLIDYGLILTFILIYFIIKNCIIKHNIFEYSFLFLLLMNTNINTQLFWFYIFTTFVAKNLYIKYNQNSRQLAI